MKFELLKLLAKNARYTNAQLADMLGKTEAEVEKEIKEYEKKGIISGYRAVIDWDSFDNAYVSAIVEVKTTPKKGVGYEETAMHFAEYREVEAAYLMSGSYDLHLTVKCKSLSEVARFVENVIAAEEGVMSVTTHFVMRRYKELDTALVHNRDDRGQNAI